MNKNFTKEDIIKKHETNVKSAQSGFALAGILGIIYVIRYFITGNFNFYFSLSVPEMFLKLSHDGSFSKAASYIIITLFFIIYIALSVLNSKNGKWLKFSLIFYIIDFLILLIYMCGILSFSFDSSMYIEVIIHIFIILFLSVGVNSCKKLG